MKFIQSSFFRALIAIIVGVLLIRYREQTATTIVQLVGIMFFLSGVVSCATYFVHRRHASDVQVVDVDGRPLTSPAPAFPLVGIGSLLLGVILTTMPGVFLQWMSILLASILILGAITQFVTLSTARRVGHVGWGYYVMPSLLLLAGIYVVSRGVDPVGGMVFIVGWLLLIYGVVECANAIKVHREIRKAQKAAAKLQAEAEAAAAAGNNDEADTAIIEVETEEVSAE